MPVNAGPEYSHAEKEYLSAKSLEDRIIFLKEMIRTAPKHKSSENFVAELKNRLRRFTEKQAKAKKSGKSSKVGIKKEDLQAVIVGLGNSGKSSLLALLTNSKTFLSRIGVPTLSPVVGMMDYLGTSIQVVEIPSIGSEYFDKGIANTADVIVILATKISDIEQIKKYLEKSTAKQIIAFNKIEPFEDDERKLQATLSSKKYPFVIISTINGEGIEELKEKIFYNFNKLRIYTKEPGKEASRKPIILNPGEKVRDIAEKILKGFSKRVKETRIWGPSSKFPGQKVGLKHPLKDMDIVEFKTK